jgi:hypothetical protein
MKKAGRPTAVNPAPRAALVSAGAVRLWKIHQNNRPARLLPFCFTLPPDHRPREQGYHWAQKCEKFLIRPQQPLFPFSCDLCPVLNDYDPDLWSLKDITAEVTNEIGFEIMARRLDFFGICDGRKMKEKPTKTRNKEV